MSNTILTVFYGREEREDTYGNKTVTCFGFFEAYDPVKKWAANKTDALDFNDAKTAQRCIYRVDAEVISKPFPRIVVNEVIFPATYLVTITPFSAEYINPPGALLSVSDYVKETPVYISDNCYYCASDWVSVVSTHVNFGIDVSAYVKCTYCGAQGPICCGDNSVIDAIDAWNRNDDKEEEEGHWENRYSRCKDCDAAFIKDARHATFIECTKYYFCDVTDTRLDRNEYYVQTPTWCPLTTRKGKK